MKFNPATIEDIKWAVPLLESNDFMGSEFAFSNVFVWQDVYDIKIGRFNDYAVVTADYNDGYMHYQYPNGIGDIRPVLEQIINTAKEEGHIPAITGIPKQGVEVIEKYFPDMFTFVEQPGNSDYVYLSSDLANLPGSKFRKKRNHCSHFERSYTNWEFKEIKENHIDEILKFSKRWLDQTSNADMEGIENELKAITRALNNYEALGLRGGYLTVDDEIVAYSYGRPMGEEFITHVEKALYDIHGGYAFINREMARKLEPEFKYINREDDVDEPGLRKAKLSYRPVFLIEKWRAEPKVWPPTK